MVETRGKKKLPDRVGRSDVWKVHRGICPRLRGGARGLKRISKDAVKQEMECKCGASHDAALTRSSKVSRACISKILFAHPHQWHLGPMSCSCKDSMISRTHQREIKNELQN